MIENGEVQQEQESGSRQGVLHEDEGLRHDRGTAATARPAQGAAVKTLRARKPELILLALAVCSVIGFASWLDAQLRPAIVRKARRERDVQELRNTVEPCQPGLSHTVWCGAVIARPPVLPLPVMTRAPVAFCTSNGAPSC